MLPYQNPQLDMEARLDDLISRMTLEELILQTDQYASHDIDVGPGDKAPRVFTMEKMEEVFQGRSVGSFGAWGTSPAQTNQIQRYAVEHTRLGIPVMFVEEGLHGASSNGCTIFPQQMGIAASFDPSLSRKMGHAIATEARAMGVHEILSPVMDLMRDPRFGRTEEAYGEDTFLASEFAREGVRGMQGNDLTAPMRSFPNPSTMPPTAAPWQA